MRTIVSKVSGVTFDQRQSIISRMTGKEPVRLIPDPTNQYDKNAIGVHVAMGDGTIEHVGFVPKELAAKLSPLLDNESIMVTIDKITGGFETRSGDIAALGMLIRVELPDSAGVT